MTDDATRCARCDQHGPHLPVQDALNALHRDLHDMARPLERLMTRILNAITRTLEGERPGRDLVQEDVQDEEIRYLHEEYETELHECVYCDRLYEAERDLDGWFESQYCDECCCYLKGEGRD